MAEAQFCYPGPDDGLKFTVPNPPPEYWKKARPFNLKDMITGANEIDPSTIDERYDLFRRDGVGANGVVRYVFEKSFGL